MSSCFKFSCLQNEKNVLFVLLFPLLSSFHCTCLETMNKNTQKRKAQKEHQQQPQTKQVLCSSCFSISRLQKSNKTLCFLYPCFHCSCLKTQIPKHTNKHVKHKQRKQQKHPKHTTQKHHALISSCFKFSCLQNEKTCCLFFSFRFYPIFIVHVLRP